MDSPNIAGVLDWLDNTCTCESQNGTILARGLPRLYAEFPPGYPYLNKDPRVCGSNRIEYEKASVVPAGVKITNCGPCGSCSNRHDVSIYREFANPMTQMLAKCALAYVFNENLAKMCMRLSFSMPTEKRENGLTPMCLNRFMDNMGCTLTHCYRQCLFKWDNPLSASNNDRTGVSHSGQADGSKLNSCLLCDEVYCSPVFIQSAGANRRCSGTVTDVVRPGDEVCQHVNVV